MELVRLSGAIVCIFVFMLSKVSRHEVFKTQEFMYI